MAINTDINQKLLDQLFTIYNQMEQDILVKIASNTKKGLQPSQWSSSKLQDTQKLQSEIKNMLLDNNALVKTKVSKGIFDAFTKGINSANKDHDLPNTVLKDIVPPHIERMILETNNLIDGTSFQILRNSMDVNRQVIADSSMGVLTGLDTRTDAARKALNSFAAKGITGFIDKAGRKWDMASYVDMAVRTTTARAALQGHIDRQATIGNDLVIVSSFAATCPICAPWGGKPLSISGNNKQYTSLDMAKSAGLFHPNCKHTITAYFPFIDDEGDLHSHDRGYDPQKYKDIQRQRHNERQIRKYKRLEAAAITPLDRVKANAKVKGWQARQREHIQMTGLRRNYAREGIRIGDASKVIHPNSIIVPHIPVPEIPRVVGHSFPEVADAINEVYTKNGDLANGGTCGNVAGMIGKLTGSMDNAYGVYYPMMDDIVHVVTKTPDGLFLDGSGLQSESQLIKLWNKSEGLKSGKLVKLEFDEKSNYWLLNGDKAQDASIIIKKMKELEEILPKIDIPKTESPSLITKAMQDKANSYSSVKKWYTDLDGGEKNIVKDMVKTKKLTGTADWAAHKEVFEEFKTSKVKPTAPVVISKKPIASIISDYVEFGPPSLEKDEMVALVEHIKNKGAVIKDEIYKGVVLTPDEFKELTTSGIFTPKMDVTSWTMQESIADNFLDAYTQGPGDWGKNKPFIVTVKNVNGVHIGNPIDYLDYDEVLTAGKFKVINVDTSSYITKIHVEPITVDVPKVEVKPKKKEGLIFKTVEDRDDAAIAQMNKMNKETSKLSAQGAPDSEIFKVIDKYNAKIDLIKSTKLGEPMAKFVKAKPVPKVKTKPVKVENKIYSSRPVPTSTIPSEKDLMYLTDGSYLGGAGQKDIYISGDGKQYIFKPAVNKDGSPASFKANIQEAASMIQKKVDFETSVDVSVKTLGGKVGTVQPVLKVDKGLSLPSKEWQSFSNTEHLKDLQKEHVTDWLLGNFDAHNKNFISVNGKLVGIDKEQAFKYINEAGSKSMSYSYHPNAQYGESEPIYNILFKQYANSSIDLDLNDTYKYIKKIEQIPDDVYKETFRNYAEGLHGVGSKESENLLNNILIKKQTLKSEYEAFFTQLNTERFDDGKVHAFNFKDTSTTKTIGNARRNVNFSEYKEIGMQYDLGLDSPIDNIVRDSKEISKMPKANRDAIKTYSGSSYRQMNAHMRHGISDTYKEECKTLVKSIKEANAPLLEDTLFYRHSGSDAMASLFSKEIEKLTNEAFDDKDALSKLKKKIVGSTFADKGFLSTAYRQGVFTEYKGIEIQIYTPKEFNNGIFIEHVSSHATESEFLFNAKQKFEVIEVDVSKVKAGKYETYENVVIRVAPID